MASNVLVLEAANLFAGDNVASQSNHLRLLELKLPELNENYAEHTPGGAPIAISVDMQFAPLEASFTLAGWQPEIYALLRRDKYRSDQTWPTDQTTFTAYGLLRDRMRGCALEAKTIIRGMLGRINATPYHRGEVHMHEYAIRGITFYELFVQNVRLYHWDFFEKTAMPQVIENNEAQNVMRTLLG